MRIPLHSLLLSLSLSTASLSGCSSSTSDADMVDAAPMEEPGALANIAVTVTYTGSKAGALVVAAFRSFPPMGPPIAFQTVAMPQFPAVVTLRDLEAGTVYVMAVHDRAPASPTQPGPEDTQAASGPLMLDGTDLTAQLVLQDP